MKCPGQDTQYWKPGAIYEVNCPSCGRPVEFFKDDTARKCGQCGHRFVNPEMDFGCAAYCQYAEQCLGTLPEEALAQREDFLKDRVAVEMKRYFGRDFKHIGHASRTARYAERIARKEHGTLPVVLCAAYLRCIGAREAERKHGRAENQYLEKDGPPIAFDILNRLKADEELIEAVVAIVGNHRTPAPESDINLKIVFDADWVARMEEHLKTDPLDPDRLAARIEKELSTAAGKEEARSVLINK